MESLERGRRASYLVSTVIYLYALDRHYPDRLPFLAAISSELSLNIYLLTLSDDRMSDNDLLTAISETPPNVRPIGSSAFESRSVADLPCPRSQCILLIEDIDVAFAAPRLPSLLLAADPDFNSGSQNITLSGLLNALDGVCSVDGRVIFATTNHIDRLDPALKRPGRFDVQVRPCSAVFHGFVAE
jgi:chaperone BCS1